MHTPIIYDAVGSLTFHSDFFPTVLLVLVSVPLDEQHEASRFEQIERRLQVDAHSLGRVGLCFECRHQWRRSASWSRSRAAGHSKTLETVRQDHQLLCEHETRLKRLELHSDGAPSARALEQLNEVDSAACERRRRTPPGSARCAEYKF